VLDNVQRRRLLVEPSREDAPELPVEAPHVELDEGAGQLLDLPGRSRLAGAKPHDHVVADPQRLARLQRQLARDAVALVEEAENRHPLRHRSGPRRFGGDRLRDVDRLRLGLALGLAGGPLFSPAGALLVTGRQRGEDGERDNARSHA
jgi:hypothetical protein